eukprot:2452032-Prymnesium_polylepis.1
MASIPTHPRAGDESQAHHSARLRPCARRPATRAPRRRAAPTCCVPSVNGERTNVSNKGEIWLPGAAAARAAARRAA